MGLGNSLSELMDRIRNYRPELIGISMMTFGYRHCFDLIIDIKRTFPHLSIAAGGPFVSTLRERVLQDCAGFDYGITLEGEHTIVELCAGDLHISRIKGLLYKDITGEIAYTGDREFIDDLDANGFPTYSRFDLEKYPRVINIVTSRGCPFNCIYCPVQNAIGKRFRMRSPGSVADEFEYWYEKGYRDFEIADDNFTLSRSRTIEICEALKVRNLSGMRISCGNGIRADKVDRDLLSRMRDVGFFYIAFGVEAGNNKILRRLRKGESIETIEKAIRDACALEYMVTLFFLLGSPGETTADIEDSVNMALRHPIYDARFYNVIPFPGTELYQWVEDNFYFIKQQNGDAYLNDASHWVNEPIFQTPELSKAERIRLYRWANRKVKRHSLKVKKKFHGTQVVEKFCKLGFSEWMSNQLTCLYFTHIFQSLLVETNFIKKIKKMLFDLPEKQRLNHG